MGDCQGNAGLEKRLGELKPFRKRHCCKRTTMAKHTWPHHELSAAWFYFIKVTLPLFQIALSSEQNMELQNLGCPEIYCSTVATLTLWPLRIGPGHIHCRDSRDAIYFVRHINRILKAFPKPSLPLLFKDSIGQGNFILFQCLFFVFSAFLLLSNYLTSSLLSQWPELNSSTQGCDGFCISWKGFLPCVVLMLVFPIPI